MGEAAYLFAMDIRDKKGYRCFATPNMERTYVFLPILNSTREEENPAEETDAGQRMLALRKFHQWQTLDDITTFDIFTYLVSPSRTLGRVQTPNQWSHIVSRDPGGVGMGPEQYCGPWVSWRHTIRPPSQDTVQ
jgi:hypothetical protein